MVRPLPNTFWSSLRGNCIVSRHDGFKKNNIRDLPLSGKWQSDLIQLEHRTPGVGVENGITPCRLSACSMLSSVEATLVGRVAALVLPIAKLPRVTSSCAGKIVLRKPSEHTIGPDFAYRDN